MKKKTPKMPSKMTDSMVDMGDGPKPAASKAPKETVKKAFGKAKDMAGKKSEKNGEPKAKMGGKKMNPFAKMAKKKTAKK